MLVLVCGFDACELFEVCELLDAALGCVFDGSELVWTDGLVVLVCDFDGSEIAGARLPGFSDGDEAFVEGTGITTIGAAETDEAVVAEVVVKVDVAGADKAGAATVGSAAPVSIDTAVVPDVAGFEPPETGSIGDGALGSARTGPGPTGSGRTGSVTTGPTPVRAERLGSVVNVVTAGSGFMTRSSGIVLTGLPGATTGADPGLVSLRPSLSLRSLSLRWSFAR